MAARFRNRRAAGRALVGRLLHYAGRDDVAVLALPRGGVPVAYEVATALSLPLDVLVVRKLGLPGHEELALGAIASGGVRVLNPELTGQLADREAVMDAVTEREARELERRERRYRTGRPPLELRGRTVILVDDGLATGSTMLAAITALRRREPARLVAAAPVGSARICQELGGVADEVVCATMPEPFSSVGRCYLDFEQTSDQEVEELLALATIAWAKHRPARGPRAPAQTGVR